jgi:hypothetical protein
MIKLALAFIVLVASPAAAGTVALILSDQEQQALYAALDAATKHEGLAIAPNTVYLMNKLKAAPTVEPQKPEPPKPPEEPAK